MRPCGIAITKPHSILIFRQQLHMNFFSPKLLFIVTAGLLAMLVSATPDATRMERGVYAA